MTPTTPSGGLAEELERFLKLATPGPFTLGLQEECEPDAPNIWGIFGSDTSYEATLCQFWSGEHDNVANASLITALLNHIPVILSALRSQGWVSVKERLPESGTDCFVLVTIGDKEFPDVDRWDEIHEAPVSFSSTTVCVGIGWQNYDFEEVMYWMQQPPIPRHRSRHERTED